MKDKKVKVDEMESGPEHLKIVTRLRDERVESVKGESVMDLEGIVVPSIFKVIRKVEVLTRMCPTFDLKCEENTMWR